ncbi:MAG: DinB family protein [Bacteroidetes bacterium]|nr:DinB family protein [Bacteroidota bacterium]
MERKERFDALDENLESLFSELGAFDESRLNKKPGPEKWSALQTLEHILLAEVLTLNYLKKKLSYNPTLKPANFLTALRRMLLKVYLRSPLPFPAPKPVSTENLPDQSDFEDLKTRFRAHRKDFREFVISIPQETYNKLLYKHLVVGRLDGKGLLVFVEEHFRRHRKQALRAAGVES